MIDRINPTAAEHKTVGAIDLFDFDPLNMRAGIGILIAREGDRMSHRVIQWGTGNVGFHSLRYLIRHPELELVGVHAHSPAKIGKDAAELAGLSERTGIVATGDVDALLALEPDAVVYTVKGETRLPEVIPELERILSSGANVVSTAMIFLIYPPFADASGSGASGDCSSRWPSRHHPHATSSGGPCAPSGRRAASESCASSPGRVTGRL